MISEDLVSRIVGYTIEKGNFNPNSPNLPQRIALLAEANTANQGALSLLAQQITSAKEAAAIGGYGSPIHIAARILFARQGGGVGSIPVYVYPQAEADGATEKVLEITPTGVATGNGTHTLIIAGRDNVDGIFYNINIVSGDTTADITAKISDAVNNVLGCPAIGTDTDYVAILTSKWKGLTSQDLSVTVDTNNNDLGITYVVNETQAGSGTPSIQAALDLFGNSWNTFVIDTYGTDQTLTTLEAFNGKPDPSNPTGRYTGIIWKPFVSIFGNVDDNPTSITDPRLDELTNELAPAPLSKGFKMEAAANLTVRHAVTANNTPHLDVIGLSYPDMPTPDAIGSMAAYSSRDSFVKKGCSTVDLVSGKYQIQDPVTTYHPEGENPPQFRYTRNIMLDFNVRYGYYLLEQQFVVDHVIVNDTDNVSATKIIKPKMWKQIISAYADDLAKRGLIVDADFMKASIVVNISTSNPDRLQTSFSYKRSGVGRISDTVATAGFNFGTL